MKSNYNTPGHYLLLLLLLLLLLFPPFITFLLFLLFFFPLLPPPARWSPLAIFKRCIDIAICKCDRFHTRQSGMLVTLAFAGIFGIAALFDTSENSSSPV